MPVVRDVLDTGKEFIIGFPHLLFSYAAHLACIEVDELTGAIEIINYVAATEAGRVINPQAFEQQIQGAIAQGIGYATSEALRMDTGRILNGDFSTYIIPTALDIPDIGSTAVETHEPSGPYGMKGVGEVGINGPLPAIANAVADACGLPIRHSPLTAEHILGLMERQRKGGHR
jgi:CO/xanthine dehydrogenase Mo-binding subunit